jgi:hypothetical protein
VKDEIGRNMMSVMFSPSSSQSVSKFCSLIEPADHTPVSTLGTQILGCKEESEFPSLNGRIKFQEISDHIASYLSVVDLIDFFKSLEENKKNFEDEHLLIKLAKKLSITNDFQYLGLPLIKKYLKKMGDSPSVTRLNLSEIPLTSQDLKEIISLCPYLQDLEINLEILTKDGIDHLPKKLKKLTIKGNAIITDDHIACLPRNLLSLKLHNQVKLSDVAIGHLPRKMTVLELNGSFSDACILKLPPALKKLKLLETKNLTCWCVALFPRSLIELSIPNCAVINDVNACMLPQDLLSLEFMCGQNFTKQGVMDLPHTLISIKWWGESPKDQLIPFLPPKLETLEIMKGEKLTSDCVQHLSREIKKLKLPGTVITDLSIRSLPPKLLSLETDRVCLSVVGIADLPRSITSLTFYQARGQIKGPNGVKQLPPHLIYFKSNLNLIDEEVDQLPKTLQHLWIDDCSKNGLRNLPPHLKELHIEGSSLNGKEFVCLPRTLEVFTLKEINKIEKEWIRDLPRTLKYLSLPNSNEIITDETYSLFPLLLRPSEIRTSLLRTKLYAFLIFLKII